MINNMLLDSSCGLMLIDPLLLWHYPQMNNVISWLNNSFLFLKGDTNIDIRYSDTNSFQQAF